MVGLSSANARLPNFPSLADWVLGLHLTPDGYRVLFHKLMELIATTWPDQLPERLPMILPAWDEVEAWKDL